MVERFEAIAPERFLGTSLTVFDPRDAIWRQTWADSEGNYWALRGGFEGERMVLTTTGRAEDRDVLKRMVFFDISEDGLSWRWERSDDDGRTWRPQWDIRYRRKPPEGKTSRRRRVIARFDAGPTWRDRGRPQDQPGWDDHDAFVDDLVESGLVVMGGPFTDHTGAMMLFDGVDEDRAGQIILRDPFVRNGVFRVADIRGWTIFVDPLTERSDHPS